MAGCTGHQDHLEPLKDFITCPVCLDEFDGKDPRSLMCLHAFCLSCLDAVYQTEIAKHPDKSDQISCPTCRVITPLHQGALDHLPKYFQAVLVKDMIDRITKHESEVMKLSSLDNKICRNCSRDAASTYCFDCVDMLCSTCADEHDQKENFVDHVKVEVGDNHDALTCTDHGRMFESFCVKCFMPICKICKLTSHSNHNVTSFCNINEEKSSELDVEASEQHLDENLQKLEEVGTKFNEHIMNVHADITEHKEKLIADIERKYIVLLDTLCGYQVSMNTLLQETRLDMEQSKANIINAKIYHSAIVHPIPKFEKLEVQGKQELLDRIKNIPSVDFTIPRPSTFQFTPNQTDTSLGHISAWTSTMPKLDIKSVEFFAKDKLISVVNGPKPEIKLYNSEGEEESLPFDVSSITIPRQVAVHHPSGAVAIAHQYTYVWVSLKYYVTLYKERSPGSWKSKLITLHGDPQSICFTLAGFLLIATGKDRSLIKYNKDGTKLWLKKLEHPCNCITVDDEDRLIVLGNRQVNVYSNSLDRLMTFPMQPELCLVDIHSFSATITKDVDLDPTSVVTDANNNILVADGRTHTVLVFSPRGRYIGDLVRLAGRPVCMALYEGDSHVVVTQDQGVFMAAPDRFKMESAV